MTIIQGYIKNNYVQKYGPIRATFMQLAKTVMETMLIHIKIYATKMAKRYGLCVII